MQNEPNPGNPDGSDESKIPLTGAKPASKAMESKKNSFFTFLRNNPVTVVAIIGLIAVAAVYFWKDIQGRKQAQAVEKMAVEQLRQNSRDMLKLMAKPLIWSIRSEMLRGNLEQVNLLTTDLVKEKNFQFIHLVDPAGIIIVSTDKKLEGQPAAGIFDANLLTTDSITVIKKDDDLLTLAAPVMGYDKRLATLVMNFTIVNFVNQNNSRPLNEETKKE